MCGWLSLTDSEVRYDTRRRTEFRKEHEKQVQEQAMQQQLLQQQQQQQQMKVRRKTLAYRRKSRRKSEFVPGDIDEGEFSGDNVAFIEWLVRCNCNTLSFPTLHVFLRFVTVEYLGFQFSI